MSHPLLSEQRDWEDKYLYLLLDRTPGLTYVDLMEQEKYDEHELDAALQSLRDKDLLVEDEAGGHSLANTSKRTLLWALGNVKWYPVTRRWADERVDRTLKELAEASRGDEVNWDLLRLSVRNATPREEVWQSLDATTSALSTPTQPVLNVIG